MKKRAFISVVLCMIMILQLVPMVSAEAGEERNPEDYLISKWDFEGSDLKTQLADKAQKGETSDIVELMGEGITIENGVMKIPTTQGTYARVACPAGSDQYAMANKTVLFRAKISEVVEDSSAVAGILGKAGLWNVYFTNAKIERALSMHCLKWEDGKSANLTFCPTSVDEPNCFPTPEGLYLTYAVTTAFDEESGNAVTTFYRSKVENPTSAEDFVVLSSGTYAVDPSKNLASADALIIGKRFGDTAKDRSLESAFADIMVYDTVLTEQEIVRVSSGLETVKLPDLSAEPDLSTALDHHLVSHYDFEGETLAEKYADKATVGKTKDSLKPVKNAKGSPITASNGCANVPGDGAHLLYTASDDIRNVYSMTFYSKLKWNYTKAGTPNASFADLMFYENLFRVFKQGTTDANTPAVFEARTFGTGTTMRSINDKIVVEQGEWFYVALTMEMDENHEATAVLYLSKDGIYYTSASATHSFTDAELETLNTNLNAATEKIYNGYASARGVDYTYDDIRFYDVALTEEELISINTPVYAQRKLGEENEVRILCMLQKNIVESCQGVGFLFATSAESLVIGGEKVADSGVMKTLYAGVQYTDSTGTHTAIAANHGSYCFAATVLSGIPADKTDTLIYVRPYIVDGDGTVSYGKISSFTVNEISA